MAIQEVMKFLNLYFIISFIFFSCFSENIANEEMHSKENPEMSKSHQNNIETTNCFNEININVEESVLVYWAEVATDKNILANHAGNTRIVIKKDGEMYYSNNNKEIQSIDNLFNTELKWFKTLTKTEMDELKSGLNNLDINSLPAVVKDNNIDVSSGTLKYLYVNFNEQKCIKFEPSATVANEIKKILRKSQE